MAGNTTLYLAQPPSVEDALVFIGTRFLRRRNSKMCKGWYVMEIIAAQPGECGPAPAHLLHPTASDATQPFCLRAKYVESGEEELLSWAFVFQNRWYAKQHQLPQGAHDLLPRLQEIVPAYTHRGTGGLGGAGGSGGGGSASEGGFDDSAGGGAGGVRPKRRRQLSWKLARGDEEEGEEGEEEGEDSDSAQLGALADVAAEAERHEREEAARSLMFGQLGVGRREEWPMVAPLGYGLPVERVSSMALAGAAACEESTGGLLGLPAAAAPYSLPAAAAAEAGGACTTLQLEQPMQRTAAHGPVSVAAAIMAAQRAVEGGGASSQVKGEGEVAPGGEEQRTAVPAAWPLAAPEPAVPMRCEAGGPFECQLDLRGVFGVLERMDHGAASTSDVMAFKALLLRSYGEDRLLLWEELQGHMGRGDVAAAGEWLRLCTGRA